MQSPVLEPLLDLRDRAKGSVRIGKIDLNVILGPHLPRAVLRKWVAGAGDDAPTGRRKSFYRGVADPAARSGEQKGAARLGRVRRRPEDGPPKGCKARTGFVPAATE